VQKTQPDDAQGIWGNTVKEIAAKWGDDQGTVQQYRDFKSVLKIHEIDRYMTEVIHKPNDTFYEPVYDRCNLKYEYCAEMASKGLCLDPTGSAIGFMNKNCAPACQTCHLMSYETRCPFDSNNVGPHALEAGELNRFFEVMTHNKLLQDRFGPMTIYSMPGGADSGGPNDGPISAGPWILTYENFLSEAECNKLIHYGTTTARGFGASKIMQHEIDPNFDDASAFRTSTTNWCQHECYEDDDVVRIHKRIETLLRKRIFPQENYEYMQLLRYETGQLYKTHSDFIPVHLQRPYGPRVLTVYLYLNTVEEGGGTNFPFVGDGITIQPKMGKAVIWPSVLDENPLEVDTRTNHGALPVLKGRKYGSNVWVHLRDFKTAAQNCRYDDVHAS